MIFISYTILCKCNDDYGNEAMVIAMVIILTADVVMLIIMLLVW